MAIFEDYLKREKQYDDLRDLKRLYQQDYYWPVSQYMFSDTAYYRHALRAARTEMTRSEYDSWKARRSELQETFNSRSAYAYGLRSTEVSPVTLISHQFLHGGIMHIFGNLLFLVIFGFAVEAALGHFRFLCFYLIGGVVAGLAQVVTTLGSDVPLVGASGAISGVMAMYLAVFRLKKIEFFYWIFFFVGYFRAPALLILPFYIGKEIYSYYTAVDSSVAFMAHAGGFVAGGILVGLTLLYDKNLLNNDYIEEDQKVSPREKALAEIYRAIESLRFDYALKQLNSLIEQQGIDFELAHIRFNLQKIRKRQGFKQSFTELMTMSGLSPEDIEAQKKVWQETEEAPVLLSKDDQLALAFRFTGLNDLSAAEQIFDGLYKAKFKPSELKLLATKLATRFAEKKDNARNMKFQEIGQQLASGGQHGVL